VETIQKMERKPFARVANKKHSAGFYANVIFSIAPSALATLRNRFALDENIFRVMFTVSPEPKPAK
ncbi:MAG: 30S ribosomal protein S6, partial [Verrucomicrobiales bacterium]|nr:30S ribosomal protein S6 [Verrucomicrobiales bacterium]